MDTPTNKHEEPLLSTKTKAIVGVYVFGCVLTYFGVPESLMEFFQTREWTYKPETDIIDSLVEAIVQLARPFIAVVLSFWFVVLGVFTTWFLGIPVGFVLVCLFVWGGGLIRVVKRLIGRDN